MKDCTNRGCESVKPLLHVEKIKVPDKSILLVFVLFQQSGNRKVDCTGGEMLEQAEIDQSFGTVDSLKAKGDKEMFLRRLDPSIDMLANRNDLFEVNNPIHS